MGAFSVDAIPVPLSHSPRQAQTYYTLPGKGKPVRQATALEWGHPLHTPDGREIRVPSSAFGQLRRIGALMGNSNKLSPIIYEFMDPQYDALAPGLRQMLGRDLSGPKWLVCNCEQCKARRGHANPDHAAYVVHDVKSRRLHA